ncbi:calcium-binding protein [Thalassovita sp.]|uniref:calcium-binding protein n=1 Tax=Thalassovita sp. TaxID=1979401 RepID=UPI0029DE5820|nr:calcium-binding protein [Thalassovita sp.]
MADIIGTLGTDTLIGTDAADTLTPYGTTVTGESDFLLGGLGDDIYDLRRSDASQSYIIQDDSADGAVDGIVNAGAFYHSASLGYVGYAEAIRVGDDLILDTPYKPARFRDPSKPSYHIEIIDHFRDGAVESIEAGGTVYQIATGPEGGSLADLIAGTNAAEVMLGRGGDDWIFGNGGKDTIKSGNGDDMVFGGNGGDKIRAGNGNDTVFSESGWDKIRGGNGADWIEAGDGNDRIMGEADNDRLLGGNGNDRLEGGEGQDYLSGDAGNDWLRGGLAGDVYVFNSRLGDAGWGNDTISDQGDAPSYQNIDSIELRGFYGPSDGSTPEAFARLSFARDGLNMVISADGGVSTLVVQKQFKATGEQFFIEELVFNAGYWTEYTMKIISEERHDIGDDRNNDPFIGSEAHEIIFGNNGGNSLFGGSGTNFIWTGDGDDVLIYKENDPQVWAGAGGGASHDIVMDFDVASDVLDFTEMKISRADLVLSEDADGDALVAWDAPGWEISDILIELRGVAMSDLTDDHFVF